MFDELFSMKQFFQGRCQYYKEYDKCCSTEALMEMIRDSKRHVKEVVFSDDDGDIGMKTFSVTCSIEAYFDYPPEMLLTVNMVTVYFEEDHTVFFIGDKTFSCFTDDIDFFPEAFLFALADRDTK